MFRETHWQGLPALLAETGRLRVVVLPILGAKIASIYDCERGREWLSTNPWLAWQRPRPRASYVREFDLGGWDECFPTIAPDHYPSPPWSGLPLADHGELWSQPWTERLRDNRLTLEARGEQLPYRFSRTLIPDSTGFILGYYVENLGDAPLHYVWSSHPLFAIAPGMEIRLPSFAPIRTGSHGAFGPPGWRLGWGVVTDNAGRCWDLRRVPPPTAGLAAKLFAGPLSDGWVELHDPRDGATFRFDFDPQAIPHVGLWLNYGGWSGSPQRPPCYNLGIEPCRGAHEDLTSAIEDWDSVFTLPPRGNHQWQLRVTIT